jgi:hypothetical protein
MAARVCGLEDVRPEELPEVPEALIAVDTRARVTGMNTAARRVLGAGIDCLVGRPVLEAAASPALCTLMLGALIGGGPCVGYAALCGESEQRVRIHAEPLLDEAGKGVGGLLVLSVGPN